ncbi:FmdB family zinc ribbon protein [Caenimonas terrae]|uniref:FmdB family zinc ribbon protein n=1 Tax=Caenimonas terrae TaxID=696074 RepID=A0ABW0NEE0_9BURK
MPIYAYKCASCGHAKDVLQKISDPQLTVCPACGAAAFQKQLTAAGFQLKGSGWYATDFKGGAAPAPAGADGAPAASEPANAGDAAKPATDSGAAKPAPAATPAAPASGKGD